MVFIPIIILGIFIIVLFAFLFIAVLNYKDYFICMVTGAIMVLTIMVFIFVIKDTIAIEKEKDNKYSYTITIHDGKEIKKYEHIDQYNIKNSGIIEFKLNDNTEILIVNGFCEIEKVEE